MSKGSWREFQEPDVTNRPEKPLSIKPKGARMVRVKRERSGKGGKTVTVVSGLELGATEARSLLKRFKASCGTGGTLKGELLELQGDQVGVVLQLLKSEGYSPKQSGG